MIAFQNGMDYDGFKEDFAISLILGLGRIQNDTDSIS